MTPELAAIILVGVVILGFLWNLRGDILRLRERVARIDGMFAGYIKRQP